MSMTRMSIALVCVSLFAGCKHVVPEELANARVAYERASLGPAAAQVPDELHKAHEALKVAEQAFADDPKGYHTKDVSYVAQRSAQRADALARIKLEQGKTKGANEEFSETQTEIVKSTREDLAASEAAGVETTAALVVSEAARREADSRTAAALAELALVKEEQRGMVITLSGSVLFRSAEATLLPEAMTKLDQVAAALLTTKERMLIIEGHTDSEGEADYNVDLSQRRADAVRTYLVSRGYDAALIQAHGIGESRPLADNTSPEGMANNRRVEIVVTR